MKHILGSRLLAVFLAFSLLFTLIPAALAAGPEEGGGSTPTLTGVSLSQGDLTLTVGGNAPLQATLNMSDGSTLAELPDEYTVSWTVKDDRTDEVSVEPASGSLSVTIHANALAGTNKDPVTVTVTVTPKGELGVSAYCQVTVVPDEPEGVTVTPETLDLSPTPTASDHTGQLTAKVTPLSLSQEVEWDSGDKSVATVSASGLVTGVATGRTTVTATAVDGSGLQDSCTVTVLGVLLDEYQKQTLTTDGLRVGDTLTLKSTVYGTALEGKDLIWTSSDTNVIQVDQGYLYALKEGEKPVTITVKVSGTSYTDSVTITVKKATADVIPASAKAGEPLNFSTLVSALRDQSTKVLRQELSYVSGLSVDTSQGTLYYHYATEGDTGAGVGTGERYYTSPSTGQLDLSQITFVPKSDFAGTAVINYTGYAASGSQFFQGTIEVKVDLEQDVTYSAAGGKVVQFSAADFNLVCSNRTGRDLSSVTFSLPDSSQGTLYYNYLSAQNPGTAVSVNRQYKYTGSPNLGDVYFLPAAGTSGEVVIPYTAQNVYGTTYRGRVTIQVTAASQPDRLQSGSGALHPAPRLPGDAVLRLHLLGQLLLPGVGEPGLLPLLLPLSGQRHLCGQRRICRHRVHPLHRLGHQRQPLLRRGGHLRLRQGQRHPALLRVPGGQGHL